MAASGPRPYKPQNQRTKKPTFCYQCVAGPDLLRVEEDNGVAVRVESNFSVHDEHPGGGRVCVKAYGLVQKTHNPNRIKSPMKRTNPKKGREHDPEFVPITWEEAFGIVADKLNEVRARGLTDESGYPRVAASFGGGGTPTQYMGTFPAFLKAWGPIDLGFGAGQGVKCYHSEHLYGEFWHRAFIVSPDVPYCNFVISCGNNVDASSGVTGVWREADARVRGLRRIQVEPHMSISAASAGEWVPIKPKTDAAFLFALIHHIICVRDWQQVCDVPYLRESTNAPYLIAPNGYYLRDAETGDPLVWDQADETAKPYDKATDPALSVDGVKVSGLERGADNEEWRHTDVLAKTSFDALREHVSDYSPDWAADITDIPADKIRQIADEFLAHACVGETIEIEGVELPYRTVAVMLGKSVNNGWGGYQATWARTVLAVLVGALEVPGGVLGTNVKLVRPANDRSASVRHGEDGFMHFPFNETSKNGWKSQPGIRNAYDTLVPLVSNGPWSPALGPAHLPWLFQKEQPENWPQSTMPDVWFCYRTNPAISSWNAPEVAKRVAEFPFVVAFAYTRDETNHMADILLPDAGDLESLQLIRIGSTKFIQQFWTKEGWAIRQPIGEKVVDCKDMTDVSTELAARTGILEDYNKAINSGAAGIRLHGEGFDYSLASDEKHDLETIWDRVAQAASHEVSDGQDIHDLEWFKKEGYVLKPYSQLNWYLYPAIKKAGLRFELPYQERMKRHGAQLANRLHEVGVNWWDQQLEEYEPLPSYIDFPGIWTSFAREVGKEPSEFPMWALTARSMQYSWGANVGLPMIKEVADNIAGHRGVIMNRARAKDLGIAEGDPVVITSPTGQTRGRAVLRAGIRPDTIVMIGQFDHWATPIAKDFHNPSLNSLSALALSLTDATGSGSDIVCVRVERAAQAAGAAA
ncbi:MAG: molybdopterin-dependent oxidoreductase [Hyphomicrobiaceae bacterium]